MNIKLLPVLVLILTCATLEIEKALDNRPEVTKLYIKSQNKRVANGMKRQVLDEDCCKQAQKWAEYMASINQMKHGGGEQIIARGYRDADSVLKGWLNSPPHKHWIYCSRPRVGFGFAKSKNGTTYWAGVYKNKKKEPK